VLINHPSFYVWTQAITRKRRNAFGAFSISVVILLINFVLLAMVDLLVFAPQLNSPNGLGDFSAIYLFPLCLLVFLFVLALYRKKKKNLPRRESRMLRIVRSIFNLHVCAAICLSLMAANALLNIPEAVRDCCPNGCDKPTLQVPSLFKPLVDLVVSAGSPERQLFHQVSTPFTTVLCPTITGCPTTKSKVSYVIGGLFLVLLVPPHFLSPYLAPKRCLIDFSLFCSVLFFSFYTECHQL